MSEPDVTTTESPVTIESPPPAPQPARSSLDDEPRQTLHRLAAQLIRTQNRKLLIEFLTLRRALR